MERLTARNENGEKEAYYPHCMREDTCDGDGASEKCDGCDFAQKVCETLASYEETGLAPEQIREIDRLYAVKCKEVAMLQKRLIGNARSDLFIKEMLVASNVAAETHYANGRWIPVEERLPEDEYYILLSFTNFPLPSIGRFKKDPEGGAFYLGDCDEKDTCISMNLFVNAWRPLPEPYRPKKDN